MRHFFVSAVVLSLVTVLSPSRPAFAQGGDCVSCGGGGHYYVDAGCGAGGWTNGGYLHGGRCAASISAYGFGYGGYGHSDWRFGLDDHGENRFSVVPLGTSRAVASAETDFENRIVAAAQRVLRPAIVGPAATLVARTDLAPHRRMAPGRNPDLAEALAGEARQMVWERRYQEALSLLEEAVRADEQSASAWYFLGLSHRALGHATAAEAAFAKGIAYHPADSAGERRMAKTLERVQGPLRIQLENARAKLRREAANSPVAVTASR